MFGLLTKKQAELEFSKIAQGFKEIKKEITSRSEINLLIENAILKNKSPQVSITSKKSQDTIETKIMNRVRRNKKALVMAEISKLKDNHSVIEMFDVIVLEKGLCSKASFYRYVASLKSQSQIQETELKQE